MALSNDLMSQFAKLVTTDKNDKDSKRETTVYGTIVEYEGSKYVRIDGSSFMTPIVTTADVMIGERVTVMIKNHLATVTGNISSPSARTDDVTTIGNGMSGLDLTSQDLANRIIEIEAIISGSVTTVTLVAETARIDDLESMNVNIRHRLSVVEADIVSLEAEDVDIKNTLTANEAEIADLKTQKLDAETAKITYANIDFSNIGKAAMEYFYSHSGLIEDVVVGGATIAGKLVGVTISGDLIEGNTIVAEKLVVKGSDGLYYKLNTDGMSIEAEQTDHNSLNGQIIKAKSITASKVAVDDLVAFDATIGGFNITDHSIYSGVKESVNNTTRGVYLDSDGQVAFGDESNYLKYYRDQNGVFKLEISAESLVFTSGKTVSEVVSSAVISNIEEFYQSNSPSALTGGEWSEKQPTWIDGKYIWRRTRVVYGDGSSEYTPSETGVCITGNTGAKGDKGDDSVLLMIESSNGNIFKNTGVATILTVNIIVGDQRITSYRQLQDRFGSEAYLQWSVKRQGETEFTDLPADDSRISDNGFILTLTPTDVNVKTVFDCSLNY
jgi:hypothetical protein